MPLSKDSSYTHLIGALKQAWEISSNLPEPDLELDLEGLEEPKWAHHSLRRTSDRFARQSYGRAWTQLEPKRSVGYQLHVTVWVYAPAGPGSSGAW